MDLVNVSDVKSKQKVIWFYELERNIIILKCKQTKTKTCSITIWILSENLTNICKSCIPNTDHC